MLLLVVCLPCCAPTQGTGPRPTTSLPTASKIKAGPAGILLYARHEGEVQILIANDRLYTRGWGGFGGGHKAGEGRVLTAARETSEETRGYYKQDWLLEQIVGQEPVTFQGFALYFVEVQHVPASTVKNHPLERLRPAFLETHYYTWVPFSELEPLISKAQRTEVDLKLNPRHIPKGCSEDSYWDVWINTLRQVHQKDGFPWSH